MIELTLAYTGTMLIAFEFVRKIRDFQTILVLIAVWPLNRLLNAYPFTKKERRRFKSEQYFNMMSVMQLIFGAIIIVLLLPLTILFFTINIIISIMDTFQQILNYLRRKSLDKFYPLSIKITSLIIRSNKRYKGVSPQVVIKNIKETELPFMPIIGVILITIAFIMQIS